MNRIGLVLVASLALILVHASTAAAQDKPDPRFKVGAPIVYANLTVAPLYSASADQPLDDEEYLTLVEATKAKAIEVTELEGNTSDAQVRAVHVTNNSDKAIFLMAGEVILGGKQDRIISNTTVIEPGTKQLEVAVFCVEQGRWDGRTAEFQASGKIGHSKLRGRATYDKEQGSVWAEVSAQNKKSKAAPETDTYKASLKAAQKNARKYVAHIEPRLAPDKKVLGMVVAIDGKPVALDAFANPRLFGKMRPALLESYALEAATSGGKGKADVKTLDAFVQEATTAKKAREAEASGDVLNDYTESAQTKGSKAMRRSKKSAKKPAVVQESYFAH